MGFYFRKSINLGLFKLNFSKSGVSISFGIKGARITIGPKGTQFSAGRKGLYYSKKVSNKKIKQGAKAVAKVKDFFQG